MNIGPAYQYRTRRPMSPPVDKQELKLAIKVLRGLDRRGADLWGEYRSIGGMDKKKAERILLAAGWDIEKITALEMESHDMPKMLKCLKCGKPSPVENFEPGMLNEEATLACPVCKSQFALYATIKSLGGKPEKEQGEEGIEPPEGAPPPPAPPAEVGGGAGSAPPPNSAPAGASPFESVVQRCTGCDASWLAPKSQLSEACPECGSDKLLLSKDTIRDRVAQCMGQLKEGVEPEKVVSLLLGEADNPFGKRQAIRDFGADDDDPEDYNDEEEEEYEGSEFKIKGVDDAEWEVSGKDDAGGTFHVKVSLNDRNNEYTVTGTATNTGTIHQVVGAPKVSDNAIDSGEAIEGAVRAAIHFAQAEEEEESHSRGTVGGLRKAGFGRWAKESLHESESWEGTVSEFTTKIQAMFKDLDAEDVDLGEVVDKLKSSGALTIKGDKCRFSLSKAKSTIGTFLAEREPKMAGNAEIKGDMDVDPTMEPGGGEDMEPGIQELPKPDFGDGVERAISKFF